MVERIDVGHTAVHQQVNHAFGARHKMRCLGRQWTGRCRTALLRPVTKRLLRLTREQPGIVHNRGEPQRPDSGSDPLEQFTA